MKNSTLLSLVAATVLFTACGEETQKAAAEVNTTKIAQAVKKDTVNAAEAAKANITEAAEAAKVAVEAKTAEASAVVKEKAAKLTESSTADMASATPEAPAAFAKCTGCHGAMGQTKALGKSAVIAGQDKEALIESLKAYQAGTKNVAGMGSLMKSQVEKLSDEDIEAIAEYLSGI